jgi:alkylhydroperoxidase/carboxymuconolactone decarboxylase family protein YurZ
MNWLKRVLGKTPWEHVEESTAMVESQHKRELDAVRKERDHYMRRFMEKARQLEDLGGEDLPFWKKRAAEFASMSAAAQQYVWDTAPDLVELKYHRVNAIVNGVTEAAMCHRILTLENHVDRLVTAIRTGGTI